MTDLKPCPFCGGVAAIVQNSKSYKDYALCNIYHVKCCHCGVQTKEYESRIYQNSDGEIIIDYNGAEKAAEAWNRRVII